jgi:putative DNA primase/helicase
MLHEVLKPFYRLETLAKEEYQRLLEDYQLRETVLEAQRRKTVKGAKLGAEPEQIIAALRELHIEPPVRKRFVLNDPTVEKLGEILNQNVAGVLLFRDEISGLLATMDRSGHENDRAFYLEAWNGYGSYTFDRIGRGTLYIPAACVSILGAITPGPLAAYLREAFSGGQDEGFLQRFQLSVYPDPPAGRWHNVDRRPDLEAKSRAFEIYERLSLLDVVGLLAGRQSPEEIPVLHFDEAAQDFFDAWRSDLEARIRQSDEHPVMIGHLSKYRSLMPSLALVFHATDCDVASGLAPVALESAKRAAAWCDFLEPHARRIFHNVTARAAVATRLLAEKIKANKLVDPFTLRDVYRHCWIGLSDPSEVARAAGALEELGWLRGVEIEETGGRPAMLYYINPKVRELG